MIWHPHKGLNPRDLPTLTTCAYACLRLHACMQVGRGAADGCASPECKYDHGYWGRPEEYPTYQYARLRRTYRINADRPGTEVWAQSAAALAAAAQLFRHADAEYAAQLLAISRALYDCATSNNPYGTLLQAPPIRHPRTYQGFSKVYVSIEPSIRHDILLQATPHGIFRHVSRGRGTGRYT